jgi:hypothetical protein
MDLAETVPESELTSAIAALRVLSPALVADDDWPPDWFGAIESVDGPVAERADEWLAQGFGRV